MSNPKLIYQEKSATIRAPETKSLKANRESLSKTRNLFFGLSLAATALAPSASAAVLRSSGYIGVTERRIEAAGPVKRHKQHKSAVATEQSVSG